MDERRDRIQGGVQTHAPARTGRLPRRQGTRRLGLAERAHAGGLAAQRARIPRIPRLAGGRGHVQASRHRQDPPRHRVGQEACRQGVPVRFYTAAGLVMRLLRANTEGKLDRELQAIAKARMIVIDKLGYVPIDEEGSRLLFQVVTNAYETQSIVYTTNIESGGWGRVFGDPNMAAAIIDRTVHHGRMIRFEGESYRRTHALMQ